MPILSPFNGIYSTLTSVDVLVSDDVFMQIHNSHFWGPEETEFMLTMLRYMNIIRYIDGLTEKKNILRNVFCIWRK